RLPGMDGLEATRRIMSQKPIPIVVVAGGGASKSATTLDALHAGALTVLEKPVGTTHADYEALAEHLCTQLVIMSQVKLVRQHIRHESLLRPARDAEHRTSNYAANYAATYSMLGIVCST